MLVCLGQAVGTNHRLPLAPAPTPKVRATDAPLVGAGALRQAQAPATVSRTIGR